MIYSANPPFIFVHIPKTAGTSIEEALYQYQDFSVDDGNIHQPLIQFRDYLDRNQYDDALKFCFVRNPFDLLYSTWKYWVYGHGFTCSFKEWLIWRYSGRMLDGLKFLDDEQFPTFESKMSHIPIAWYMNRVPQTYWFVDEKGNFLVDFIGCFEFVKDDFNVIVNHLKLTDVYLPHANRNRSDEEKDYRVFYDDETRQIIEDLYSLDLSIFGYSFDEPIPQRENFGFVKPEKNSIKKFGEIVPVSISINHTSLPYGFSQNLKRHTPGDDFETQIREFELEKLKRRARSLESNLRKIYQNITNMEDELFDMEDDSVQILEKQKLILSERQLELLFKTKLTKINREISTR